MVRLERKPSEVSEAEARPRRAAMKKPTWKTLALQARAALKARDVHDDYVGFPRNDSLRTIGRLLIRDIDAAMRSERSGKG